MAVSTGAIFARLAGDAPSLVIAAYRLGLAALVLGPVSLIRVRHEFRALSTRDILLALVSGFFLALHFATWITSLAFTSVANSVVLVNTNPLWVGLLTPLITKDRIQKTTLAAIVLSVAGGGIIGAGDWSLGGSAVFGDLLALAGGVCAAFYLLLGRTVRRKLSLIAYITLCYTSAALIMWTTVLALGLPVSGFSTGTYGAFLGMAVVSQLVGHTSYNWALKWFSAGLIAVSLLGEPIFSAILAYFLFDEGLTMAKAVGGALIMGAIYLAASGERTANKGKTKKTAGE